MFPLSISGKQKIADLNAGEAKRVRKRVEQLLRGAQASEVWAEGSGVHFRVHAFRRASRYNVLSQVDRGQIEILEGDPGQLRYEISCRRILKTSCLMALLMLLVVWAAGIPLKRALGVGVLAWSWLFLVSYVFCSFRLPLFLRAAHPSSETGLP